MLCFDNIVFINDTIETFFFKLYINVQLSREIRLYIVTEVIFTQIRDVWST